MKRMFLLGGALLALAACATGESRGPGVYETPISADRTRIVHQGPAGMPAGQVEDVALLRAAERTVRAGYEWFVVDNRYTEATAPARGNGPFLSIGGGSTNFGRSSAVGLGGGIGFNLGGTRGPALATTLEVRMGRGPAPNEAYNARDVQQTIGARQAAAIR